MNNSTYWLLWDTGVTPPRYQIHQLVLGDPPPPIGGGQQLIDGFDTMNLALRFIVQQHHRLATPRFNIRVFLLETRGRWYMDEDPERKPFGRNTVGVIDDQHGEVPISYHASIPEAQVFIDALFAGGGG